MPSGTRAALLLVALAGAGGRGWAQAPLFPGDSLPQPAFPTALTVSVLALLSGGQRATRLYAPTVGVPDIACDTLVCRTEHLLTGSLGVSARLQVAISPRMGVRVGVAYTSPKRKVRQPSARSTITGTEHLNGVRAEALLLWRLKRQVPVYFGAGAALARRSEE